ncbi:hypothetical protein GOP80_06325 [Planococcaceae bacterium Storch 2/2-2]|nr:hypothetical protein [Planococcaceae bacterium Storch 2/2-2]
MLTFVNRRYRKEFLVLSRKQLLAMSSVTLLLVILTAFVTYFVVSSKANTRYEALVERQMSVEQLLLEKQEALERTASELHAMTIERDTIELRMERKMNDWVELKETHIQFLHSELEKRRQQNEALRAENANLRQPHRKQPPLPVVQTGVPLSHSSEESQRSYYANCSEARAAGVTPIYRGQPGYASHLDRDNDGIACE